MNTHEAQEAFKQRRIQPHCPGCGSNILMKGRSAEIKEKGTYNRVLVSGFQCAQCSERFIAYIGDTKDG